MIRTARTTRSQLVFRKSAVAILVFGGLAIGTSNARAQVKNASQIDPIEVLGVDVLDMLRRELHLEIDQLERVCKLDVDQKRKLQLAAKGAVDQWYNVDRLKPGDQKLKLVVGALSSRRQIDPVGTDLAIFDQNGTSIRKSIHHQTVWRDALQRVLTPEQCELIGQERKERLQYRRDASVRSIVAAIDQEVQLSEKQRKNLESTIRAKISDRNTAVKARTVNWAQRLVAIHEIIDAEKVIGVIPLQEAKKLLNEHQLEKWVSIVDALKQDKWQP